MPNTTPADQLRAALIVALDNANHTHPCPATGSAYWTGCYHPDGTGPSCHSERRADAVLSMLPAPALAVARQLLGTTEGAGALDDEVEFEEPVCVDECGSCGVCGYEVFGTPAEGWREAARFLRRTPRDSADFSGALRGARLIEDELRRRAEARATDAAPPAPVNRAALTDAERQFLTFAMDMAADEMSLADGFTDEDEAALAKFRALATPPAAPAVPEEPTP
ncbi:hypothetical protein [Streptomyces sp. NPDC006267]|uniref:hypothetical protein n=1 Tax=Streptomyces sp. NPDC006267 TaxID=3157173 RepID=UPI0033BF136E